MERDDIGEGGRGTPAGHSRQNIKGALDLPRDETPESGSILDHPAEY